MPFRLNFILAIAALLATLATARGQSCSLMPTGAQTGPQSINFALPSIGALLPFDDGSGPALIAAGRFTIPPATPSFVARLRNGIWSPMHTGLPPQTGSNQMRDLAIADFSSVGGPGPSLYVIGDVGPVYRWTGANWTPVAAGVAGAGSVLLTTTDALGPVLLLVRNQPDYILAWRGTGAWAPYAPLPLDSGAVRRIRVVDDGSGPALFAVGNLRKTSSGINCIAKLVNGQWTSYPLSLTSVTLITDITSFDAGTHGPELYLTGQFSTTSTTNAGAARLRNGSWEIIGDRVSNQTASPVFLSTFFKINEGNGEQLFLGGTLGQSGLYEGIVRLGSSGWEPPVATRRLNSYSVVSAMARFDDGSGGATYIGGDFDGFRVQPGLPEVADTYSLLKQGAAGFTSTAQGLGERNGSALPYYRLATLDLPQGQRLFAGSPFDRAGGRYAKGAALFDGTSWSPLSTPWGEGNAEVSCATVATLDGQPRIVAWIRLSTLGPIAYWDGAQWVRMTAQPTGTYVSAIAEIAGSLTVVTDTGVYRYTGAVWQTMSQVTSVGGPGVAGNLGAGQRLFFPALRNGVRGIYASDGTNALALVGPATPSTPLSVHIHDEGSGPALYITSSNMPGYIQRLSNGAWSPLGTGLSPAPSFPISLASFDDGQGLGLYAAGAFTSIGGVPVNGIARWRNGAWSSPWPYVASQTTSGLMYTSLAATGDRLYIAGDFTSIADVNADRFAWIQACPRTCVQDYDNDGDSGTDADIEAFFLCLAGTCCNLCTADFNNDGDTGTDADIESFFRVLAGGPC